MREGTLALCSFLGRGMIGRAGTQNILKPDDFLAMFRKFPGFLLGPTLYSSYATLIEEGYRYGKVRTVALGDFKLLSLFIFKS